MGDAATVENASGSKLAEVNNDQVYKSGSSQEKGTSGAGEENNASNATGTNVSRNGRVSKIVDADNDEKSMDGEEHKVTGDGKPGARKMFRRQKVIKKLLGVVVGGERGEIGGKNRLLELRNHENNGAEKMRSSKFPTDGKAEETRKAMDSSDGKTMEHQNDEDSKDLRNKPGKDGTDHRMSEVHKTLKRHRIAHDRKELTNGSLDGQPGENRSNDMKQRPDKGQESRNRSNMNSTKNSDEQVKIIKRHEKQEQTEDSDPETGDRCRSWIFL
ncbi:hypothetical protein OIU77_004905 [Salix suchowensis]|uniref:Uncharacterized protein n=1 Tax=Salix suchowensis TaxID=1278906 RepID=A0ABQ9AYV1_9ROSI|nr:hypothetical protein OIU77_004905 [Salix suchowensis]